MQRVLGPEHPDTLSSMNNLAIALRDMGQHAEAAQQHRRALAIRQRVLGPEHPDTLSSMSNLAMRLATWGSMRRRHSSTGRCWISGRGCWAPSTLPR